MTLEEALKIAAVIRTADCGCDSCCRGLVGELNDAFPDFVWTKLDVPFADDGYPTVTVKEKTQP